MLLTIEYEQNIINQNYNAKANIYKLLPIKVTTFFQQKIDAEVKFLGHTGGPLHRITYPSCERLEVIDPNERADFVNDTFNMRKTLEDIAIQKYNDRIIFFSGTECVAHCQYCFRQTVLNDQRYKDKENFITRVNKFIFYLQNNKNISEVILSGGEPILLTRDEFEIFFNALKKVSHIKHIRLHTKALIYAPELFTKEKLELFAYFNVRIVFHIVHPYEICNVIKEKIAEIKSFNIKCYNQFPLIRNINDHHEVIIKLLEELDEIGVRTLSIFYPDAVSYSANFRISFKRIFTIIDYINFYTPAWINAVKFTLDTVIGKVQRENLIKLDEEKNIATFVRDGKFIEYPNLSAQLDTPGDIKIMLWREY